MGDVSDSGTVRELMQLGAVLKRDPKKRSHLKLSRVVLHKRAQTHGAGSFRDRQPAGSPQGHFSPRRSTALAFAAFKFSLATRETYASPTPAPRYTDVLWLQYGSRRPHWYYLSIHDSYPSCIVLYHHFVLQSTMPVPLSTAALQL